jgi:hypothetical protein
MQVEMQPEKETDEKTEANWFSYDILYSVLFSLRLYSSELEQKLYPSCF